MHCEPFHHAEKTKQTKISAPRSEDLYLWCSEGGLRLQAWAQDNIARAVDVPPAGGGELGARSSYSSIASINSSSSSKNPSPLCYRFVSKIRVNQNQEKLVNKIKIKQNGPITSSDRWHPQVPCASNHLATHLDRTVAPNLDYGLTAPRRLCLAANLAPEQSPMATRMDSRAPRERLTPHHQKDLEYCASQILTKNKNKISMTLIIIYFKHWAYPCKYVLGYC